MMYLAALHPELFVDAKVAIFFTYPKKIDWFLIFVLWLFEIGIG